MILKVHVVNSGLLPLKGYARENLFKLMLFDVGLLGSMGGLPPKVILDADYGNYKGYFAENFVAQEMIDTVGGALFCWQEKKAEVEFLVEIRGEIIPLEVKSGSVIKAKSLKIFSEKYHPSFEVIFSGHPLEIGASRKIHYYPLYLAGHFPIS